MLGKECVEEGRTTLYRQVLTLVFWVWSSSGTFVFGTDRRDGFLCITELDSSDSDLSDDDDSMVQRPPSFWNWDLDCRWEALPWSL